MLKRFHDRSQPQNCTGRIGEKYSSPTGLYLQYKGMKKKLAYRIFSSTYKRSNSRGRLGARRRADGKSIN
jgi:hypothetical protein